MDRQTLVRRVVLVCAHFARNRAYYLEGWDENGPYLTDEFWITVNGNFMDIAVLEWCKLFADDGGHHSWKRVVNDRATFEAEMYASLGITSEEFAATVEEMRKYRDKFIAHLDRLPEMNIPHLDIAWDAVRFYHKHLATTEAGLNGLPLDLNAYAEQASHEAEAEYERRLED